MTNTALLRREADPEALRPPGKAPARRRTPFLVGAVVFLLYGLYLAGVLVRGDDLRGWIGFGHRFVDRPHAAALMHIDPHSRLVQKGFGVDGQFYYFMAVDPVNARYFMDQPAYRYKRILYPLTARLLALGQASLVPYTMILVGWLAAAAGTVAVAAWLRRKRVSPWLALIYGLYPGLFFTFHQDYTEPLAYALMALAVYLYSFGGQRQLLGSSLCFALAALTRDKVIAFAGFYWAGLLVPDLTRWDPSGWLVELRTRIPRALIFGAVAGVPVLAYQLFLKWWLHDLPAATGQVAAPLSGAAFVKWGNFNLNIDILCVVIPAAICTIVGLRALWRREWHLEIFALLITIQLSVTFANSDYWKDARGGLMRVSIAVVLLALYCVPIIDRVTGGRRRWLWISGFCWLLLLPSLPILFANKHL